MTWGDQQGNQQQGGYGGAYSDPITGEPRGYPEQAGTPQPYLQQPYPQQPCQQQPYPQSGFPQSGYPQPGFPQPQPGFAPPRRGIRPGVLVSVVAVVVAAAIAVGVVFLMRGSTGEGERQRALPAPSSSATSPPSSSSHAPANVAPVVPGWQVVASTKKGLAYDVPPGWTVESPGTVIGYERPDPKGPFGYKPYVAGSGAAQFAGDCTAKDSHRAQVAILSAGEAKPDVGARGGVALWLQGAAMDKKGTITKVEPDPVTERRIADGSAASSSSASVDLPADQQSGPCAAKKVHAISVAVSVAGKTRVLIVEADQAGKTVDGATMDKIAASLRPLH
ncbi:hypothetical protein [Sciscionella marina]|uniref:hypothetical protein n=1 Tax=Sciscionella marina TaxID=508770 RepID=UPI0012F688EA|nr:hypothetical protein [Sciscionella marina]